MEKRDRVIDKIKKLLALASNNSNVNEVASAALKAQALIAEYDIEQDEIYDDKTEREVVEVYSESYKGNKWAWYLAKAIADNFRCRVLMSKTPWSGNQMIFLGYDTDAEACSVVFNHLLKLGNKLADKEARLARKQYGTAVGVKGAFLVGDGTGGFVGGIRKELEKQCQALMLVVPKSVDDYIVDAYPHLKSYRLSVDSSQDRIIAEHGFYSGRDAVRKTRIGEQKKLTA